MGIDTGSLDEDITQDITQVISGKKSENMYIKGNDLILGTVTSEARRLSFKKVILKPAS